MNFNVTRSSCHNEKKYKDEDIVGGWVLLFLMPILTLSGSIQFYRLSDEKMVNSNGVLLTGYTGFRR